jgi:hypothetical protein
VDYPFDVYEETTIHIGTHWGARDDSYSSVHINFYVPKNFLLRLVTEYSDRFTSSVERCLTLLENPLFGRENGERLELSTNLGGMVPLKYWVIRENDMPPQYVIDTLGQVFEQFVRSLVSSPFLLFKEERQGRYHSSANIEYRRSSKKVDAQLELRLDVPATATKERFEAFRSRALSDITFRQQAGKSYLGCDERPSSLGYGLFALHGETHGNVTIPQVHEEVRRLFQTVDTELTFQD